MKKDPLFEDLLNQGCIFEECHGFERPAWFARDGRNEVSSEYPCYMHARDYRLSLFINSELRLYREVSCRV